jgi:hypothetical protein
MRETAHHDRGAAVFPLPAGKLGVSMVRGRWIPTAYSLAPTGCLPVSGAGGGLPAPANSKALRSEASPEQYGTATGMPATARNPGMAVGIAVATLLYAQFGGAAESVAALRTVRAAFAVIAAMAILYAALRLTALAARAASAGTESPGSRSEGEIETCIYR